MFSIIYVSIHFDNYPDPDIIIIMIGRISAIFKSMNPIYFIIGSGIFFRVYYYLYNPPFWRDEIRMTKVIDYSILTLFYDSVKFFTAPFIQVFIKLSTLALGTEEWAYRFPIISISIINIFLFYFLIKKHLPKPSVWIALTLFCFSNNLIFFSVLLKQYQFDVCATLLICFLLQSVNTSLFTKKQLCLFSALGIFLIFLSQSSIFILCAMGLTHFFIAIYKQYWQKMYQCMIMGAGWIVAFIYQFFTNIRAQKSEALVDVWNSWYAFFPIIPERWIDIFWLPLTIMRQIAYFLGFNLSFTGYKVHLLLKGDLHSFLTFFHTYFWFIFYTGVIVLCVTYCFIIGFRYLYKHNKPFLIFFSLSFIIPLLASILHLYPYQSRLTLFLFPLVTFLILYGFKYVTDNYPRLYIPLLCILLIQPIYSSVYHLFYPRVIESDRYVLEELKTVISPNDTIVYVNVRPYYINKLQLQNPAIHIEKNKPLPPLPENQYIIVLCFDYTQSLTRYKAMISKNGLLEELYNFRSKGGVYTFSPL